ncbi:MAG: hypothetical protein B1H11_06795 [Desulfobacteraceae bacterium 4484_190.1]|nr:MAG: hypothetical protein B1H11_06795 [Desulfobacteraceae bacterium 4484_190.1]
MDAKVLLAGKIDFFPLEDIFQALSSNNATGILHLNNRYSQESAVVYFEKGNIINATYGSLSGIDAVYPLFGWSDGDFSFTKDYFDQKKVINQKIMEIVLDGLRMLDEGEIEKITHVSVQPIMSSGNKDSALTLPIVKGPLVNFEYVLAIEDIEEGQEIVHEGRYGDWLWVILEGSADIIKNTKKGPVTIMRIAEGAFIGSMHSFLFQDNIRSATVRAFEKMKLGTLDIQSLSQDFVTMSHELRQFLISLDKRLREVTDRIAEFSSGTDIIYREIAEKKRIDILQYHDRNNLYSIVNGSACMMKKTDKGPVILAKLGQGDFIDFFPIQSVDNEISSTVVFGSKDIELKKINAEVLQAEYERIPVIFKNMAENISTCISVTAKLACNFHKRQNFRHSAERQKS